MIFSSPKFTGDLVDDVRVFAAFALARLALPLGNERMAPIAITLR